MLYRPRGNRELVPTCGHRQHRTCHRSDGGSCLCHYRSVIYPYHIGKPGGMRSSRESAAPCVLGHPTAVPFLQPPVSPAWVRGTSVVSQLGDKTTSA